MKPITTKSELKNAEFKNLDDLFDSLKNNEIDDRLMSDLPIFSYSIIENTNEVWSWDDDRAIVGTHSEDYKIVSRNDLIS